LLFQVLTGFPVETPFAEPPSHLLRKPRHENARLEFDLQHMLPCRELLSATQRRHSLSTCPVSSFLSVAFLQFPGERKTCRGPLQVPDIPVLYSFCSASELSSVQSLVQPHASPAPLVFAFEIVRAPGAIRSCQRKATPGSRGPRETFFRRFCLLKHSRFMMGLFSDAVFPSTQTTA